MNVLKDKEKSTAKLTNKSKKIFDIHAKDMQLLCAGDDVMIYDPVFRLWYRTGKVMEGKGLFL